MSRVADNNKRKRSDAAQRLSEAERELYHLIRSKEDMGISPADMKRETELQKSLFHKSLKSLQTKKLIKDFFNRVIQQKCSIAAEFKPSKELTGGAWYVDGELDFALVHKLRAKCKEFLETQEIATLESVSNCIAESTNLETKCTTQQISEIMQDLVLDNEIMEVKSTGLGDYAAYGTGTLCYKIASKAAVSKFTAMASTPCGACPLIYECTPDGIISPSTCVYFKKMVGLLTDRMIDYLSWD